jgi:hypothetical protein
LTARGALCLGIVAVAAVVACDPSKFDGYELGPDGGASSGPGGTKAADAAAQPPFDAGSARTDGSASVPKPVAGCAQSSQGSACVHCVLDIVRAGSGLDPTLPCLCQASVCKTECGAAYCAMPQMTTDVGDGCDFCLVQAMTVVCKTEWQAACAPREGASLEAYCSWPDAGLSACGY